MPIGSLVGHQAECDQRPCNQIRSFYGRSNDAVIRVYDDAGNVIETHGHMAEFMAKTNVSGLTGSAGSVTPVARVNIDSGDRVGRVVASRESALALCPRPERRTW
jgi:hypothetical protein